MFAGTLLTERTGIDAGSVFLGGLGLSFAHWAVPTAVDVGQR